MAESFFPEQFVSRGQMAFPEDLPQLQAGIDVTGRRFLAHQDELIGDLCESADHHHRTQFLAASYNLRDALDGGGILHRGPAKFHDYHERTVRKSIALFIGLSPIKFR